MGWKGFRGFIARCRGPLTVAQGGPLTTSLTVPWAHGHGSAGFPATAAEWTWGLGAAAWGPDLSSLMLALHWGACLLFPPGTLLVCLGLSPFAQAATSFPNKDSGFQNNTRGESMPVPSAQSSLGAGLREVVLGAADRWLPREKLPSADIGSDSPCS